MDEERNAIRKAIRGYDAAQRDMEKSADSATDFLSFALAQDAIRRMNELVGNLWMRFFQIGGRVKDIQEDNSDVTD